MNITPIKYKVIPCCFDEEGDLTQGSPEKFDHWSVFREPFAEDSGYQNSGWIGDYPTKELALAAYPGATV